MSSSGPPQYSYENVMITPKSDAAIEMFPEFCARVQQRLESGKRVYGDSSFDRTMEGLVEEIRQEVLDVAGWAVIAYAKLDTVDKMIQQLGALLKYQQERPVYADLLAASRTALDEMCKTTAPRNSFTDAVDTLDAAISAVEKAQ